VFYETVLGFIWPVGAAALLAIPATWYFIRHWLSKYPVQIENSVWIYISALAIVLLVVTASMAVQAARLMRTNPAEVLKKE
jgi:ABC-type antimicrobial peptide transport system permease subunit